MDRKNGRHMGIVCQCLQKLLETLPPNKRVTVDVLCQNTGGIAFWRSAGFVDYCLTLERDTHLPRA